MGQPGAHYDEDELVMDLAEGQLSYREIAAKHGISVRYVGYLIEGKRRPELQGRIEASAMAIRRQARRLGGRLTRTAWARLGTLAAAEKGVADETQRKAAVDILKIAQADGQDDPRKHTSGPGADLTDLSDETKAKVLAELGGPDD